MEGHRPQINSKSKRIVKKLQKGNNSVDDVYTRLYNDYEEHKERQKILENENMPPFAPKINQVKYFNKFVNKRKYNNTNNSLDRFVSDDKKNKFFLESQFKIIGDTINTKRTKKQKKNKVKNTNNYLNISNEKAKMKSKKYDKNYRPTQETNNSTIGLLNTEGNTLGFTNRYITTENPIITESNQFYLPTSYNNYNNASDDKINEISENNLMPNYAENSFKNNNYFAAVADEEVIDFNNTDGNYSHYNQSYDNNNDYNNYQNLNKNNINNECINSPTINKNKNINNNDMIYNNMKNNYNEYENNFKNKNSNDFQNNEQEIINKNIKNNQNNLEEERNNINDTNNNTTFENVNASNMNCCIGSEQMFKDEEILQELNEVKLKTKERQEKNGENISERSEDDPLYRLNVRDSTPDNIKENVVIPSNKYQNFFDVEEIQEL